MSVDNQSQPAAPRHRFSWKWISLICVAFGMLIWVKLRIVTGVPRAVYADPNDSPRPVAVEPKAPADDFVTSASGSALPNNAHAKPAAPRAEDVPPGR